MRVESWEDVMRLKPIELKGVLFTPKEQVGGVEYMHGEFSVLYCGYPVEVNLLETRLGMYVKGFNNGVKHSFDRTAKIDKTLHNISQKGIKN